MDKKDKQAVILLAGEIQSADRVRTFFKNSDFDYYAADAGYLLAEKFGIKPSKILGDFDSAKKPNVEDLMIYPSEKDQTDSELALELCIEMGYREIFMIAPFGGRFDHTFANLSLLEAAMKKGVSLKLYDGQNLVYLLPEGRHEISSAYRYLSFFPWKENVIISLEGMKYPLNHYEMVLGQPIGISNEPKGEPFVEIHSGVALCVCVENNQEEL